MPPSDTPSAAEIEAAVAWAKEHVTWPTPWEDFVRNARVLLHLHAQVATLTARAEQAEANSADLRGVIDNVGEKWLAAVDRADAAEKRAEALAARVATLEAALRSIAANTCCGQCREAALVARAALTPRDGDAP